MSYNIAALAAPLWFQRIAIIASGDLDSIENSLRHAYHLVQLAPVPFRRVLPVLQDEDEFERLLGSGQLDAAARQLLGPTATLLLEAGPNDQSTRAVIACTVLRRAIDGIGETPAAAMLKAWTSWLMMLRLEFGAKLEDSSPQVSERSQPDIKSARPGAK